MKTTSRFWQCSCDVRYIHPHHEERCNFCGDTQVESPPASVQEVEEMGFPLGKSHITGIGPRTAHNITCQAWQLSEQFYNDNIVRAALTLVRDDRGDFEYVTQWSSGTTVWMNPQTGNTLSFTVKGNPK